MSTTQSQITNRIAELRAARGMTQAQLAAHVGIRQHSIANIENGKHFPRKAHLEKLCEALGVNDVRHLFFA